MMKSPFDGAFSVNGLYLSGAFFYLFQVAGMVRPFVSVGFHTSCGYGNPDQIFCSGFGQSRFDPESMFFTGVHCSAFTPPLIVIGIKGFQNNVEKSEYAVTANDLKNKSDIPILLFLACTGYQ